MSDLAEFVAARLRKEHAEATREAESLARFEERPGDWTRFMCDPVLGPFGGQSPTRDIATGLYVGSLTDPHRVLREVEAKRAILDEYVAVWRLQEVTDTEKDYYRDWVIRHLAAAWSDHPDYDQEWKP